jgi:two-component system, OmpR family, sensor kinase
MAVRYGGRVKLDGSTQTLILPADVDMQRRELESLKKELAAAQAQGQAYARELAAVFARHDPHGPSTSRSSSPSQQPASADALAVLVAAARTLGAELRGVLSAIGRDISRIRDTDGEPGEIAASVGRHVTGASELVADLARLGACPVGELPRHSDVVTLLRDAVRAHAGRAERRDVQVDVTAPADADVVAPTGALTILFQVLLDHAISASPAGSRVGATIAEEGASYLVLFDDAGPTLPAGAKSVILSRDFEAIAHGRPSGLALIAAYAIAAHLAMPIELEEGPHGGARVRLTVPKGP